MNAGQVLVLVLTLTAFGVLTWMEIKSRRNK
jgi:hypothetical protein